MIRVFEPWTSPSDVLEVNKALIKKQISGSSTYIGKLEEKFTQFIGMKYGIAVSNGSVALDLALQTLDLDENDEIILPAFSIISCLSSIIRTGAKPVFSDVDKKTWNITLDEIKKYKSSRTKGVLVVHTYGLPAEIDEISKYCKENDLFLIEDAAEAHGIKIGNKYCGSYGDLSTFSFYANKHITSGEGGMILTNNKDFYKKIIQMRNLDFKASNRFVHDNFYWNYRISGLQAALAFSQIDNVEKIIKKKQQQARVYNELFKNNAEIITPEKSFREIKNNYWVYGIVLKEDGIRDELMESLYKKNIETRPFFWPLHLQPAFREQVSEDIAPLPVSENLGKNGLYLPMGAHINKKIQTKIVKSIEDTLAEITK